MGGNNDDVLVAKTVVYCGVRVCMQQVAWLSHWVFVKSVQMFMHSRYYPEV